jgi:hypothetical protein
MGFGIKGVGDGVSGSDRASGLEIIGAVIVN